MINKYILFTKKSALKIININGDNSKIITYKRQKGKYNDKSSMRKFSNDKLYKNRTERYIRHLNYNS